ncbi:MAG: cysteine desulfurase family protein [Planctomycetaceae bacterium]
MAASPLIYLDHHATTPVDPRVLEAMLPFFRGDFANADSLHAPGRAARAAVESARSQIAERLQITPRELIFTSGATEANNLALKGVMQAAPPGSHLIINAAEHSSILETADRLARRGCRITILPVDREGRVAPESVAAAITPETALVSVMTANNEIGTLNDLAAIGALCRARGVLLHTDAVAALGRISLSFADLPVDLASISAHKISGPKGIGALFVRRGDRRIPLEPQLDGGGHEHHLRSGTLPVPLIVGFGTASSLLQDSRGDDTRRLAELHRLLWQELSAKISGLRLNGPINRLPGNLNVSFDGLDGDALLTALDSYLAVSSGAACSASNREPSHVLRAIGLPDSLCRASLRFGLGRETTGAQITQSAQIIADQVARLRAIHKKSQPPG